MLEERDACRLVVVERDRLVEDREVTRLADIGCRSCDEPQRIVVEAGTNVCVPAAGQRLVLMISGSVLKLRGSNVNDPLPCLFRNQMNKAKQILTGITEAHAAADAGFVVAGRPGHVERDHALILVPDVHHTVDLFIAGLDMVPFQQVLPVCLQLRKCFIRAFRGLVFCQKPARRCLVDDIRGLPFLVLWIFCISENE